MGICVCTDRPGKVRTDMELLREELMEIKEDMKRQRRRKHKPSMVKKYRGSKRIQASECNLKNDERYYSNHQINISDLIDCAPQNVQCNIQLKSNSDSLYQMISTEYLRYSIIELMQSQKADIITQQLITQILKKWKPENFPILYLKLINDYKLINKPVQSEIHQICKIYHLTDVYHINKQLDNQEFSIIKLVTKKSNNQQFAAKIVEKQMYTLKRIDTEKSIMRQMDHSNIIKLYDIFESKHKICYITEILSGYKLINIIKEKRYFNESIIASIFCQITNILVYIHSKGIIHRNIVPSSFIFKGKINNWNKIPYNSLTLVDFSLAEECNNKILLNEYCGNPIYMAPEMYNNGKSYNNLCDIWSAGCILYELFCGYPPYNFKDNSNDRNKLLYSVRFDKIDFDPEYWSDVSCDAKNLILKLLEKDLNKRYNASQILNHEWMKIYKTHSIDFVCGYIQRVFQNVSISFDVIQLILKFLC